MSNTSSVDVMEGLPRPKKYFFIKEDVDKLRRELGSDTEEELKDRYQYRPEGGNHPMRESLRCRVLDLALLARESLPWEERRRVFEALDLILLHANAGFARSE